MKPIHTFTVVPKLPPELEPLRKIAYNLRWCWDHESIELFRRLDRDLWETSGHNPVKMLGTISQEKLELAKRNQAFLAHMHRVSEELDRYLSDQATWCQRTYPHASGCVVAYFSAEFGLTECMSIFAGGLGILAGDLLKSASDLGLNLVGVGLLYQQGYFRQHLDETGWQQESYVDNDFYNLPITLVPGNRRDRTLVQMELAGRRVYAQVWKAQVGRVPLYLLDTNIPENSAPEDRDITDQLYIADPEMRLKQEILLGIGGYRALAQLGIHPDVWHMNEGHSAFVSLEHIRSLMRAHQLSFEEARILASASLVFTTHTPVMAGHDFFSPELMERYFGEYYRQLGLSTSQFMSLGRQNPSDEREPFCMTVLALRMASLRNGVSKLHGQVTRRMWQALWPEVPVNEVPIGAVTNGVHLRTWISYEMNQLYDRYLGPDWREEPADAALWERALSIPPEELWRTHERRRERLVAFARQRLAQQLRARGAPPTDIELASEVLDPDALTIGFARRFATYKRAYLLLRDPERLARLLNNTQRPVQIIYAGKAHPRDEAGKQLIRQVVTLAQKPEFRRRMVFLEEYDLAVARYMVQGVDVWLNTPRRPLEASGTSGMKAAANGVLNVSTLDGWWDEAWTENCRTAQAGWAIGRGEEYNNPDLQDAIEAEALYNLLEREIIPCFYDRGPDKLPRRWIERMKATLACLCSRYNTHRMVRDYIETFYLPAYERREALAAGGASRTRALALWLQRIREQWNEVRIDSVESAPDSVYVGEHVNVRVRIYLGKLSPDDVLVEIYRGRLDSSGQIQDAVALAMEPVAQPNPGFYLYEVLLAPSTASGLHGFTVRVLPYHPDLPEQMLPGLIRWA